MLNKPFVFALNFDHPHHHLLHDEKGKALIPIYCQLEMDEALAKQKKVSHKVGYDEGFLAGEKQAIKERDVQLKASLDQGISLLHGLLTADKNKAENFVTTSQIILQAIIEKLFPLHMQKHGLDELGHAIETILNTLIEPEPICIALHPDTLSSATEQRERIEQHFKEVVTWKPNENLQPWECHIEWKGGGARWNHHNTLSKIEHLLNTSALNLYKQ
jgi:hypothetical protein